LACTVLSCVASAICTDFVKTLVAPEVSPGIFDEPVLVAPLPFTFAVAYNGDRVVHIVLVRVRTVAVVVSEHTGFVEIHAL
jgi:hypothetical protein